MKIAVCFSGQLRTALECAPNLRKFFSSNQHEIDFFIHTWDITSYKNFNGTQIYPQRDRIVEDEEIQYLKEIYKPKLIKIENYSNYIKRYTNKGYGNGLELWYSFYKSISLKKYYERKYKFKYDFVIKIRLDCMFRKINEFDKHIELISNASTNSIATHFKYAFNWKTILTTISANDIFFISNSKIMDSYSTFFIDKIKYDKTNNTSYINNEGYGYTQYMHTFFKNINPIDAYDDPFVLRDAYKHLAKEELDTNTLSKIEEADGFYYSYYKNEPDKEFYIHTIFDKDVINFDDINNKIYLNEIKNG